MMSIRARLSIILMATTGLVWLCAVIWIYASTQAEVERVLDARLQEAARMVSSLIDDHRIDVASAADIAADSASDFSSGGQSYRRQLSCQIWSLEGTLIGRSESAPNARLASHASGFQETVIDGERWRVFAVTNERLGVRVLVGDNLAIRDRLVGDVVKGLLLPAVLILPVMALFIWVSVGRGLAPVNRLAASLSNREATNLSPLPEKPAPGEIRPMIAALNGLLKRVGAARQRERNFTAFAAHELKTPLAGLKTQAQIATLSADEKIRADALSQITLGVDRTSRLVRQLLDLASAEADDASDPVSPLEVGEVVKEVLHSLEPLRAARDVSLAASGDALSHKLDDNRALVTVALRNIVENALQHARKGGGVELSANATGGILDVVVEDDGEGVCEADLTLVTQRFFRGGQRQASGSGLGLSIVETIALRLGGALCFENRPSGGLRVRLSFPLPAVSVGRHRS